MRALTVRQPWAGLIAQGVKDVENRTWAPSLAIGTRFAVHAGRRDYKAVVPRSAVRDLEHPLCAVSGVVVCTVELVDITRTSRSRWAEDGYWHWVLGDVYAVHDADATHIRGRTGLWQLDD